MNGVDVNFEYILRNNLYNQVFPKKKLFCIVLINIHIHLIKI